MLCAAQTCPVPFSVRHEVHTCWRFKKFRDEFDGKRLHCKGVRKLRSSRTQVPAAPWHLEQSVERLVSWSAACGAASVSVGPRGGDGFKVEGHGVVTMLCPTSRRVTEILRAACPRHDLHCSFCSDGAIGESITLYRRM